MINKLPQDLVDNMYFEYKGEKIIVEENAIEAFTLCDMIFYIPHDDDNIIALALNANDVFYWGCADFEFFGFSDIPFLYEMCFDKDGVRIPYGNVRWICLKRKMRPQHPIEDKIKEMGYWTDDLEALPVRGNTG